MSRRTDLEQAIRECFALISQYESIARTESDPRIQLRARRAIEEQLELAGEYFKEYSSIIGDTSPPPDIAEMKAALDSRRCAPSRNSTDSALHVQSETASSSHTAQVGSDDIEFVNRSDELNMLQLERLKASKSPCILINAPAGYGKSYLVKRLIADMQADNAADPQWSFCVVDFAKQADNQITHIIQAITGQSLNGDPADLVDQICTYVRQELAVPISSGRRPVLMIFDAVDRLEGRARQWLYMLLDALDRRSRIESQEIITLRFIIASRDVESFWKGYEQVYPMPPVPQRVDLTPFGQHSIQDLIWRKAQAVHVQLNDPIVVQIAEEISYLGGGHPLVIRNLVDDLAQQTFAIGPVSGYFAEHRGRLIRKCLSPVVGSLTQSLDERMGEAVQNLSVFRRINVNTVQALIYAEELPPDTIGLDLLGEMRKANLLNGPRIQEPFYRDDLARRVLALDMAYWSPKSQVQYERLNKIARDLYKDWIHNLGQKLPDWPLKTTQRLFSIVEWLFHALQEQTIDESSLLSELCEHVRVLSQGDQPQTIVDLIADEIEGDAEVCYLLKHRLGQDGISTVCDRLRSWSGGR